MLNFYETPRKLINTLNQKVLILNHKKCGYTSDQKEIISKNIDTFVDNTSFIEMFIFKNSLGRRDFSNAENIENYRQISYTEYIDMEQQLLLL